METYRFFIDRKVTDWIREWHEIEAESLEAAKKEMIEAFPVTGVIPVISNND